MSDHHYIIIKRNNYERLIKGEPLVFDGRNFGLDKEVVVMFAETEDEAMKQIEGMKVVRHTKDLGVQ